MDSMERFPAKGRKFPKGSVIYFLFKDGELSYIGSTNHLARRLRKHRFKGRRFDEFSFIRADKKFEKMLIRIFKPPENIYSKK